MRDLIKQKQAAELVSNFLFRPLLLRGLDPRFVHGDFILLGWLPNVFFLSSLGGMVRGREIPPLTFQINRNYMYTRTVVNLDEHIGGIYWWKILYPWFKRKQMTGHNRLWLRKTQLRHFQAQDPETEFTALPLSIVSPDLDLLSGIRMLSRWQSLIKLLDICSWPSKTDSGIWCLWLMTHSLSCLAENRIFQQL